MTKRIAHMSDIHSRFETINVSDFKDCDILLCGGNLTRWGHMAEVTQFLAWLSSVNVPQICYIAGSKDEAIGRDFGGLKRRIASLNTERFHYLEDSSVTIDGVKIYGSPFSKKVCITKDDAYNSNEFHYFNDITNKQKWDNIPKDIDILLTNEPPFEILDSNDYGSGHVGSKFLRERIESLENLKAHCFGKVEANGILDTFDIKFVNSKLTDSDYKINYYPNIFELDFD